MKRYMVVYEIGCAPAGAFFTEVYGDAVAMVNGIVRTFGASSCAQLYEWSKDNGSYEFLFEGWNYEKY